MEFVFRDHTVHVTERGPADGEVVVLHHGLFASASGYDKVGLIDALATRYRVWALDSFGHGDSADARSDGLNGRDARADLVAALAEDLGVETFHFVGYSMGGWIGGAFARRHPHRLRSLSIGGWDPGAGLETAKRVTKETFGIELEMELVRSMAASSWPEVNEASPERMDGWAKTWEQMSLPSLDVEHLASLEAPCHLWCGEGDAYFEAMRQIASDLNLRFDRLDGDHMTAYATAEAAEALLNFLAHA